MRKRIALNGIAIVATVLAGTLAWSAPAAERGSATAEATGAIAARQPVTVQRLLSERVEWTVRMARALRALELTPAEPTVYGTQTIVDEPDPTSARPKGRDYWPTRQKRSGEHDDEASGGTLPAQPLQ